MELEDKVSGVHTGLTEEQKERILNEVERERRKVMVLRLFEERVNTQEYDTHINTAGLLPLLAEVLPDQAIELYYRILEDYGSTIRNADGLIIFNPFPRKDIKEVAVGALPVLVKARPEEASKLYERGLQSGFGVRRATAAHLNVLVNINPSLALRFYREAMSEKASEVKEAAASTLSALAKYYPSEAIILYKRALEDIEQVRLAAIDSLPKIAEISAERAGELYEITLMRRENEPVLRKAAKTLGVLVKLDPHKAEEIYKKALRDKRGTVGTAIVTVLETLMPYIHYGDGCEYLRAAVGGALGALVSARPALAEKLYEEALADYSTHVRVAIASALGELAHANRDKAEELIERALNDKEVSVRAASANALETLVLVKPDKAERLIERALNDKSETLIYRAISRFRKQEDLDPKRFDGTYLPKDDRVAIRVAAATALRNLLKVRPEKAHDLYRTALKDEYRDVRMAAMTAMATSSDGCPEDKRETSPEENKLGALIETLREDNLEPIDDEEYRFLKEYLHSKYCPKDEKEAVRELKVLVQNPDRDYGKLRNILEAGESRDLDEMIECCELDIPGFTIISKVSSAGGSSVVYAAIDERVKPQVGERSPLVAVKLMIPEIAMGANLRQHIGRGASDLRTIFLKDIENLETLSHPNIAKILGKGEYKNRIFIVQRYYEASSLEDYLQEVDFMGAADKIIEGASYLHRRGLVHRDIKPSNIFLTGDQDLVVIGDLQTCRRPAELVMTIDEEGKLRGHGFTHGTSHSAPEVLVEHYAEQSADVYSLGLVLWRMLTGRKLPFSYSTEFFGSLEKENHRETHEVNIKKMLEELPDSTSEELKGVIRRCIEFDPKNRYADASLMLEEFRRAKQVSGQQYKTVRRSE